MTAVIDRTDHAVAKLHYADRGVHVACRADSGVNHDTCHNKDLIYFAPDQETGHIEVMDRHIKEDPARDANIVNRRGLGVMADDMEQMRMANLALLHSLAYTTIIGIETPVEADL